MNKTAITATPPAPAVAPEKTTATDPLLANLPLLALKAIASLRVTVVLFALSLILVYYGTWVQKEMGIWTAVDKYFRSAIVFIPIRVLSMYTLDVPGAVPYPGGWLLGGLLLGNLLAAHAVRFKLSWKRSGIFLIHAGIIVMMLGELVTGMFSIEGHMRLRDGEAVNYVNNNRVLELAITRPIDAKTDDTVVIPGRILRKGGNIQHDDLPFDVMVERYMVNSALIEVDPKGKAKNPDNKGIGQELIAKEKPEAAGIDGDDEDHAAAYLKLKEKGTGKDLGTYLVSVVLLRPQDVKVGDKIYQIALRFKRIYRPYTLHLINMRHDKYLGTNTPKNFSSLVRLVDPERGEDREVLISMNDPLRHRGETFYQSSMERSDTPQWTQLAVVRNPGWLMPYFSCAMVAIGMLIHFGLHLVAFLGKALR